MPFPRILIAGLAGGSGKTLVSLGLVRSFTLSGKLVKTFKKGPDYIDAAWLSLAAGTPKGNLDPFFSSEQEILQLFTQSIKGYELSIIEGNRGLYDGLDKTGSCSSAELAKIISTPVILTINCTKMTRTVAALVMGCLHFDPAVNIAGVILNHTGSQRQRSLIRSAIEHYTPVPVLGAIPRHGLAHMEERSMGLPLAENTEQNIGQLDSIAKFLQENIDIQSVWNIATTAKDLPGSSINIEERRTPTAYHTDQSIPNTIVTFEMKKPVIAYAKDAAFWFYYEENLRALEDAGADLLEISLLDQTPFPDVDGLYISGSIPFDFAKPLSQNRLQNEELKKLINAGLPVYAECGGLAYLCKNLKIDGYSYPMAGVFDATVTQKSHPQGLGYVEGTVSTNTPFHPKGLYIRGHEFHFSTLTTKDSTSSIKLNKGHGLGYGCDGLVFANCFASYMHIYAPALPHWAPNFVALSLTYQDAKR